MSNSSPDELDKSIINRLSRIEGQVRGVQRLIADKKSCEEILTQISAIKSGIEAVSTLLISHRMKECLQSGAKIEGTAVEEALNLFKKYRKIV